MGNPRAAAALSQAQADPRVMKIVQEV